MKDTAVHDDVLYQDTDRGTKVVGGAGGGRSGGLTQLAPRLTPTRRILNLTFASIILSGIFISRRAAAAAAILMNHRLTSACKNDAVLSKHFPGRA